MDRVTRAEQSASPVAARRRFLQQMAAAGVTAGAASLPAIAQDTGRRSANPQRGQLGVAETLANYAVGLTYERSIQLYFNRTGRFRHTTNGL